jgi:ABC-type tungstate transport system substrate-binding protein
VVVEILRWKNISRRGPLNCRSLRFASVGMTKGRVVLSLRFAMWDGGQQVPRLRSTGPR